MLSTAQAEQIGMNVATAMTSFIVLVFISPFAPANPSTPLVTGLADAFSQDYTRPYPQCQHKP